MNVFRRRSIERLREVGRDPDVRFTYANERTFLAWVRTALALIVAGLAVTQFLPEFGVAAGRRIIGLPLIALGALVALTAYRHWFRSEETMRRGEPLPPTPIPRILAAGVGVVAVLALVFAALGSS